MTSATAKISRWLRIIVLGCALGIVLVALTLCWERWYLLRHLGRPFQLSEAPMKGELSRVIDAQLAAFREGDFATAYTFAAASLQSEMSPETFEEMVKSSFPPIAHSRSASFGIMLDNGENAAVNVSVVSELGRTYYYQYILEREPKGWRIIGVARVQSPGMTI